MKRDKDTINLILTKIETELSDQKKHLDLSAFRNETQARQHEISEHVRILLEEGLIKGQMSQLIGVPVSRFIVSGITDCGYNYLDTIRSQTTYNKVKTLIATTGLGAIKTVIQAIVPIVISVIALKYGWSV